MPGPTRIALDGRVTVWRDTSVLLGGAPWGVLRIAPAGRGFVERLRAAGAAGLVPADAVERRLAAVFLARGIAHPVIEARPAAADVEVVVPVYGQPAALADCLAALRKASPGLRIVVVDDASPDPEVGEVARSHGAVVVRHQVNRGPAAARNTGLAQTAAPIVAFLDADCTAPAGWLDRLVGHFDDPRVAAVAPRVAAPEMGSSVLQRFQAERSPLDMGRRPQLVAHGAPLGYVPSAALLIRRSDDGEPPFDEAMRLGEDVDLIWRLVDAGRLVRYDPSVVVTHAIRPTAAGWLRRIADYGYSAGDLDSCHPGRLTPARLSGWNVAVAAVLLARRPRAGVRVAAAAGIAVFAAGTLGRRLRASSVAPLVAPVVVGKGLAADAAATGHLLRREWWPVGWLAVLFVRRSAVARAAAAAMLVPPAQEWLAGRRRLDPARYLLLRLAADAAYGCGVIVAAVRLRRPRLLLPTVRLPAWRAGRSAGSTKSEASTQTHEHNCPPRSDNPSL